jgi:hypothetical protein
MKANGDGNNAWKALLGENTFNKIPKENLQQIVNLLCEVVIWYKAISTYKAYVEKYQLNGDQAIASA